MVPEERLNLLQLCAPAEVGGLERVVQGLSIGLACRGHRVTVAAVVSPGADTGPLFDPLTGAGVETLRLELPARAYLRERAWVRSLLDGLRPDVLHTHGYRPDLLHAGTARRRNIATISTLHGSSRMGGLSQLFEWVQERALRRFDGVVAVSAPLVQELADRGVARSRIHHIPNAWAPPRDPLDRTEARIRLGIDPDAAVVGWVGRLIPIKAADLLLDALKRIEARPWIACLIGDGPEREDLEQRAAAQGLTERVRFAGAIPEAARFLAAFDVFVMSSRSEGTPMVLLEAMAAGVPVVATVVGGIPFMVEHGREGWLVPSGSAEGLAEALATALGDPREARARAARARERLHCDFDPELWITRHETLYRQVARHQSAR